MSKILEVKDLSFAYRAKPILKSVSFDIVKGDFLGIIGPNGSGKSTLVKLILKMLTPLEGNISIMGEDIRQFAGWSKIGYVSQKAIAFNGDFPATVEEVVGMNVFVKSGIFLRKPKNYTELVYEALHKVGMQDYGKSLIGQLSGGQQQRVFIARVLAANPEILFLDEPTTGIDAESEEAVYCLLARLNQELGITVVIVTHDIGAITVHANKLICLGDGGLIVHDISAPITDDFLSEIYGYRVYMHGHKCKGCAHETCKKGAAC